MMFKDKYIHKLYAFGLAAVFALTLAGCGGGGGTAQMPEPEPPAMPDPTPQETCEADGGRYNADGSCTSADDLAEEMALSAAQEAAMAAYMAAMAAVGGAKDPVAMANAQAQADMAKGASDAAAMATTSEMAMEYQMKAEMYRDMAMEAAMERGLGITTLSNAAANQSAIDSAKLVGVAVPAPISNAGRVGRAMGTAAGTAAATPDSGDGVGMANHQGAVAIVSASDTGGGPRFTVSATPVGDTNNTAAVTLGRGEAPTALTMRGGWAGAELVASTSGATGYKQNAIVFTDINPPAQSYITDTTNTAHLDATELAAATSINTAVVGGEIPTNGGHFTGTYNADPTDNNPPRPGRFFCPSGTPCSISVDPSGVLRAIQGYTFQPVMSGSVMRQDSDYLAWGVWIHVPNAVPGVDATSRTNPATVAAFASGSDPFQVPAALTGTATYNGVASGLYAAGGMVEYFEADASLSADFGGRSGNDSTPATEGSDGFLFDSKINGHHRPTSWPAAWTVDGAMTLVRVAVAEVPTSTTRGNEVQWRHPRHGLDDQGPDTAPGPPSATVPTGIRPIFHEGSKTTWFRRLRFRKVRRLDAYTAGTSVRMAWARSVRGEAD